MPRTISSKRASGSASNSASQGCSGRWVMYSSSIITVHIFAEILAFGIDAQRVQMMIAQDTQRWHELGFPNFADTINMSQTYIYRQVNNFACQSAHRLIAVQVDRPPVWIGRWGWIEIVVKVRLQRRRHADGCRGNPMLLGGLEHIAHGIRS